MQHWTDGSGRLNLSITLEDAESGYHQGDCESDVRALMTLPYIAEQVNAWPINDLRSHLLEYGAWEEADLVDEDMCHTRTLWLACADVVEQPEEAE